MTKPRLPEVARRALIRKAMRTDDPDDVAELLRLACPEMDPRDRSYRFALARAAWVRGRGSAAFLLVTELLVADDMAYLNSPAESSTIVND